jgi:intein/homing endonuclease
MEIPGDICSGSKCCRNTGVECKTGDQCCSGTCTACFIAGTKIKTPDGEIPIERIKEGDSVIAVSPDGKEKTVKVLKTIFHPKATPLHLTASGGYSVDTTAEHPFMAPSGTFVLAGELSIGDEIMALESGAARAVRITSIKYLVGEVPVYNLEVEAPNTYIANGFVVHNKGSTCAK